MFVRTSSTLSFVAVIVASLAAGCVVTKKTGTDNEVGSSGNTSGATSAAAGTGSGGAGGGSVGAGGDTTSSGEGGSTTSTGEGGGTTTTTSSGSGGGGCVGPDGTGQTAAACSQMAIAATGDVCGDASDEPPPGLGTCERAFEIFTAGSAENLLACLSQIGVEPSNACDIGQVDDCVIEMYAEACTNDDAIAACDELAEACGSINDPFDVETCRADLNPFGGAGLQEWADCINANPDLPCQDAYDLCLGEVLSF